MTSEAPSKAAATVPQRNASTLPVEVLRVIVVDGPSKGLVHVASGDRLCIGSAAGNDVVLDDPRVSRFHVELRATGEGIALRDAGSTNGTFLAGARLERAVVPVGTELVIGQSRVRLESGGEVEVELLATDDGHGFGEFQARSSSMRRLLARVERAARSDVAVLLVGESGTGKELLARALHEHGPRRNGPFETVDCASLSPTLVASQLFGHERGAFTGADRRHVGAFERAHGGTIFLDEIGELPEQLQPMLLGALERKRFRRLGGRDEVSVDVRVVCATHRDLRAEVNAERFRLDLYYRLAVVRLEVPPLRERLDDLEPLVRHFAAECRREADVAALLDPAFLARLRSHTWPGNVRELRNVVDATLAMGEVPTLDAPLAGGEAADAARGPQIVLGPLLDRPYKDARRTLLQEFEDAYLKRLLERSNGNVSQAARDADMDRSHLWELLRRHGLR
jgi:DNA-binding NtrC family response regulator